MSAARRTDVWTNWAGTVEARPEQVSTPSEVGDVVAAVLRARESGSTVRMVGSGHSFTGVALTDGELLHPEGLRGITDVDRTRMRVQVSAGTSLAVLNAGLEHLGLSLHNLGDIDAQTVAGALATGTHGSGGTYAGLAPQVVALDLVTGTGEEVHLDVDHDPELVAAAAVSLGAFGIVTSVTFSVEPLFLLEAVEQPLSWREAIDGLDDLIEENHHVDLHWFPHTDRLLSKRNNRLAVEVEDAEPVGRVRGWVDDEFLSNTLFGGLVAASNRVPQVIPRMNLLTSRALSARSYSDVAHRVLTSPRRVRFREMEYAVPRADAAGVLTEARRIIDASDWKLSFPVEIRSAPADDVWLSTSFERDVVYLAFHSPSGLDHRAYFEGIEPLLVEAGGRPHWGKLHSRTAANLAPLYDRFADFVAYRDRFDPDRVFANGYLTRVLGE